MSAQLPDPEITDNPEREQLLGRAILMVATVNFEDPTAKITDASEMINSTVNACGTKINSFSDYTLSLLCNHTLSHDLQSIVAKGIYWNWDEKMVNDFINSGSVLYDTATIKNPSLIEDYLRTLSYYKELAPIGESHAAERARQVSAILRFTTHLVAHGSPEVRRTMKLDIPGDSREFRIPYINDVLLRGLLINSEVDREAAIEIVTTRNIFDVKHIIALLDNASAPLASGNL